MWTKVNKTSNKNMLLKLFDDIDYKIMTSTRDVVHIQSLHMIYVFFLISHAHQIQTKAVITN